MFVCSICGNTNEYDGSFCEVCGSSSNEAFACDFCGATSDSNIEISNGVCLLCADMLDE